MCSAISVATCLGVVAPMLLGSLAMIESVRGANWTMSLARRQEKLQTLATALEQQ